MSNFPIVATVLSMILGLSVIRLLLGMLTVFAPLWEWACSRMRCAIQNRW